MGEKQRKCLRRKGEESLDDESGKYLWREEESMEDRESILGEERREVG